MPQRLQDSNIRKVFNIFNLHFVNRRFLVPSWQNKTFRSRLKQSFWMFIRLAHCDRGNIFMTSVVIK
jgi:hypothetical protein